MAAKALSAVFKYKNLGSMWYQIVTIDKAVNRRYKFHLGVRAFVSTRLQDFLNRLFPVLQVLRAELYVYTGGTMMMWNMYRYENPWFDLGTGRSPQTSGSLLDAQTVLYNHRSRASIYMEILEFEYGKPRPRVRIGVLCSHSSTSSFNSRFAIVQVLRGEL